MNVEVYWNGTNISQHLVSYKREQTICDGIGIFSFTLDGNASYNMDSWDTVILYEDGIKKGTYHISQVSKAAPKYDIVVDCQDGSKRLSDYFINTSYYINYESYTRYWITLFLQQAGVDYYFNVSDNGTLLSNETTLGMDFALGTITTLLKQSGWYIYFNENNTAIIGKADVRSSLTLTDQDIVEISLTNDDKYLRNRAVVWGGSGYYPGSQIGVALETNTPWNIDKKDKRSVVYTHSGIRTSGIAYDLAKRLLNEFDTISSVKTLKLAGVYDLSLGDLVNVENRDVYSGNGVITSISSEMSSNGLFTTILLDEKCPRMFGFYSYGDEYVYGAYAGHGVWRKPLPSPVWEDYSAGLIGRHIIDLKVNNGLLACVELGGYGYKRLTSENAWTIFGHGNLDDINGTTYSELMTETVACAIEKTTNNIYWGIRTRSGDNTCWIVKTDADLNIIETNQILVAEDSKIYLYDIDTDDTSAYATVRKDHLLWIGGTDYYCNYSFTTNEETSLARNWSSSQFYAISDPFLCQGKVYYVGQLSSDITKCRVYVTDHTSNPNVAVTTTASASYSIGSNRYLDQQIYYDLQYDLLYFMFNDTSGAYGTNDYYVYSYNIGTATFNYVGTFDKYPYSGTVGQTSDVSNGRYLLVPYKYYGTLEEVEYDSCNQLVIGYSREVEYGCLVHDLVTCNTSSQAFGTITELGYNGTANDTYSYSHAWSAKSFGRINGYSSIGFEQDGDPPCDDTCNGEAYDDPWIYKYYLIWFNFDCESGSFTDYGINQLHPNPTLCLPDGGATVHDTLTGGFARSGTGSYSQAGPYAFIGFTVEDDGPWRIVFTPNPLCPLQSYHYELLGDRGVPNPSTQYGYDLNQYARTYKINLATGAIELVGYYSDDTALGSEYDTYLTENLAFDKTANSISFYSGEDGIDLLQAFDGNFLLDKSDSLTGTLFIIDIDSFSPAQDTALLHFISADGSRITTTIGLGGINKLNYEAMSSAGNGENIIWTKIDGSYGGQQYSLLKFYEFSSWQEIYAPAYLTIRDTPAQDFIIIDQTSQPHQLEISNNGIISTFAYSGIMDDSIRVGYSGGGFWSMFPNVAEATYSGAVNDIRVVRAASEVPSGFLNLTAAYNHSLDISPIAGVAWSNIQTSLSGIISKVETSNFQSPVSMFYSTYAGNPISGANNFYQRLSGGTEFQNMSMSIPPTKLLVIRLDDRI